MQLNTVQRVWLIITALVLVGNLIRLESAQRNYHKLLGEQADKVSQVMLQILINQEQVHDNNAHVSMWVESSIIVVTGSIISFAFKNNRKGK